MKQIYSIIAALLLTTNLFLPQRASAQMPQKMSYQAVIRNSNNALVTNQSIGMRISILQGSADGTVVYTETQKPTTNANGLMSIEIGGGAGFSAIDWATDIYFIKTETDPAGGIDYTITGTSQLLSVPYALHAKTAESLSGGITETDPSFTAWNKSTGVSITESQISDLGKYIETETDPVFGASAASGISSTNIANWNNKLDNYSETDPSFTTWNKSTGISITESQISDLGNYIETETDPVFGASVAKGISATDTASWNNKLDSYTETDPSFTVWNKSTGISITESQISDLGNYIETETDPVFRASVAKGITGTDTINWNNKLDSFTETDPLFAAWDKSTGVSITKSQISDLGNYIETETDPVFRASVAKGITGTDTINWNNKLDSFTETDPLFAAWDKSIGVSITKSQVSDLGNYIETETDPVFGASVAKGITSTDTASWNNKLDSYTETDPLFSGTFNISDPQDGDLLKYDATTQKWVKFTPNYADNTQVTADADGLMSKEDKTKLDGLTINDGSETKLSAGTSITITGNGTSASPYVIKVNEPTYTLGNHPELGGYVFWINAQGTHGLVAEGEDSYGGNPVSYTKAQDIVQDPESHYNRYGPTYTDWRLPSHYEFRLMAEGGVPGLDGSAYYWTSVVHYTWTVSGEYIIGDTKLLAGQLGDFSGDYLQYDAEANVRAIRSF